MAPARYAVRRLEELERTGETMQRLRLPFAVPTKPAALPEEAVIAPVPVTPEELTVPVWLMAKPAALPPLTEPPAAVK